MDHFSKILQSEQPPIERVVRPFQRFSKEQAAGGIVLMLCAATALVWANSPWESSYESLWATEMRLGIGRFFIEESLLFWINDALMAVFFFVVGLEIKRELVGGELSSPRRAALPVVAAIGGMVVPALIYAAFNATSDGSAGWAILMATDIAFALGVLALLGSRAPLSLTIFLTAFAIVDDIGAIIVIALFYTGDVSWINVAVGGGLAAFTVERDRAERLAEDSTRVNGAIAEASELREGFLGRSHERPGLVSLYQVHEERDDRENTRHERDVLGYVHRS